GAIEDRPLPGSVFYFAPLGQWVKIRKARDYRPGKFQLDIFARLCQIRVIGLVLMEFSPYASNHQPGRGL
ncbi:MAG: hypothetical protein D6814_01100, partial [Calditrichaeota bacterium]